MLIDIFKEHQGKILKTLMDDLNQSQRTELFMQMLYTSQQKQIFKDLVDVDVKSFWNLLSKERRLNCFELFDQAFKLDFFVSQKYLDVDQKYRLWDNMGQDARIKMWNSTRASSRFMEPEFAKDTPLKYRRSFMQKKILKQITVVQRVRLWDKLDEPSRASMVKLISKKPSEAIKFWSNLNYDKKCSMIHHLETADLIQIFQLMSIDDKTILNMMCSK